jgi:hypothetical protein
MFGSNWTNWWHTRPTLSFCEASLIHIIHGLIQVVIRRSDGALLKGSWMRRDGGTIATFYSHNHCNSNIRTSSELASWWQSKWSFSRFSHSWRWASLSRILSCNWYLSTSELMIIPGKSRDTEMLPPFAYHRFLFNQSILGQIPCDLHRGYLLVRLAVQAHFSHWINQRMKGSHCGSQRFAGTTQVCRNAIIRYAKFSSSRWMPVQEVVQALS